uniref:glycoside hydrolase family 28 protein n=1 Tax=uncultured Sunxiuqinia sp. TaxID=1573825 RepID=UPI0030DD547F
PIYGKGLENIAITGEGVIDGSGDAWRQVKRSKMTDSQWKKLVASGGIVNESGTSWFPSESFKKGFEMSDMNVPTQFTTMDEFEEIKDFLRPVMVSLVSCNKVLLDGPVFQNSPAWNIHPLMCENLTVRNIDVRNPWYSQNGDGIDIESCKNTVLYDSRFDVGDDAICIKSGKDQDGRDRGIPTENLIIKNCIVYHGHGGVTVGSEMSGGVKNMHVSGCTFMGTDVGLRFKSTRGRGGVVEGIYISDIDMIDIPTNAISFNLYYGGLSVSEMLEQQAQNDGESEMMEVTEETPQFKDISIKNVIVKGAKQAIYLQGLPEMNLENVLLEDLVMEAENGLFCMDANGVTVNNLKLKTTKFPAVNFYNVQNVSIKDLSVNTGGQPIISVNGSKTKNVDIVLSTGEATDEILLLNQNVNPEAVKVTRQ